MSGDPNQATITVTNSAELTQALNDAVGGETIYLATGDYGDFNFRSKDYSSTVTITSADYDNMAVFNTMDFYAVTNITVDHVFIDFTPDETTVAWDNAFEVTDSSYVTLSNSVITGGPAIYGSEPDVDPSDLDPSGNVIGLPAGRAVGALRSDHITIINNEISEFHKGITTADSNFVTISFNDISNLRTTPLNGVNVDNLHIEGNHFHSSQPWNLGGIGDHGDYIHFWTSAAQIGPTQNVTIINNFFQQGDGQSLLGVYLEDKIHNKGFENVVIDGNVIHNGDSQGLRIEGVDGLTITNNTLLQSSGGMNDAPGMNIEPTNQNVFIANNITAFVNIEVIDPINANIITQNNFLVQGFDPKGANYIGDLFMDPLNSMATLDDLMVMPDSLLNGSNYGADVTQFSVDAESINVIESSQGVTVLNKSFSAFQYSSLGETDLTNAVITWDYGDGTTSEGLTSDHAYSMGGTYDITMSINLNGNTITDTKTIEVQEMVLTDVSFNENSVADQSNSTFDIAWVGTEAYSEGLDGTAAHFNDDGAYISIKQDISMAGLDELSYQFDIQITAGDDSEIRPFWSHSSYGVRIQGDTINTYLWTSEGEQIVASSSATNIRDGNSHTVTVVFDGTAGTLSTLVDGVQVSYQGQISGTVAVTPHDVWIGGTVWGHSFVGTIDNVVILADSNIISDGHSYRIPPVPISTSADTTTTTEPVLDTTTFVEPVVTKTDTDPVVTTTYTNSSITTASTQDEPIATTFTPLGDASVAGDSLILSGRGYVDLGQISGLDAFTVNMDVTADTSANDNLGAVRLMWNHERFGVEMDNNDIIFRLQTDTGDTQVLRAADVNVNDGASHNIIMGYDSATGRMSGYVDSELVAEATGITGRIAESDSGSVTIGGSARGRDFKGEIGNVSLWSDADHTPHSSYSSPSFTIDEGLAATTIVTTSVDVTALGGSSLSQKLGATADNADYNPDDYWDLLSHHNPLI